MLNAHLHIIENACDRSVWLADRNPDPADLRKRVAERLGDLQRQRLDQVAAPARDDLLDLVEHHAVVHRVFDRILDQCTSLIDLHFRIDEKALAEKLLLVVNAVTREEGAVLERDRVGGSHDMRPDLACR